MAPIGGFRQLESSPVSPSACSNVSMRSEAHDKVPCLLVSLVSHQRLLRQPFYIFIILHSMRRTHPTEYLESLTAIRNLRVKSEIRHPKNTSEATRQAARLACDQDEQWGQRHTRFTGSYSPYS